MHPFSHCFLINRNKRKDRLAQVTKECARVGIEFERLEAVEPRLGSNGMNAAKFGCLLSHALCVKLAKDRGYKSVLILEDDVIFSQNFREDFAAIKPTIAKMEWDIFHLGAWALEPPLPYSEGVVRLTRCTLGHAYGVTARQYGSYLDRMNMRSKQPGDDVVSSFCKEKVVLMAKPILAWQRPGKSDLVGKHLAWEWPDEDGWFPTPWLED